MAAASSASALSTSGKVFFGSLCAGTFGLGCWQTQRYFEKMDLVAQRQHDLSLDPTTALQDTHNHFQRRRVQGTFRHDQEVLIGPRGPPLGALERSGGGGMASGPQGYYIVTPLDCADGTSPVVFVNRGWVPRHVVKEQSGGGWLRPTGRVQVEGVLAKPEKPRFITPQHDFSVKPLQLFWMDASALEQVANVPKAILLTQIQTLNTTSDSTHGSQQEPIKPPLQNVGDFKTTPSIHAGYAVTWYGMSAAGLYMTRKLISRGRA